MSRKRYSADEAAKLLFESSSESDAVESSDEREDDEPDVSDNVEVDDDEADELDAIEDDTDDETVVQTEPVSEYVAKSGKRWSATPPIYTRRRGHNVVNVRPGLTDISKAAGTIKELFLLFFPNEILEHICIETNRCARHVNTEYNSKNPDK